MPPAPAPTPSRSWCPSCWHPGADPAPLRDPSQARFRLFDAVTGVLRSASRGRPLLLVLDDLHTADPSSLALLHFLARNLRGLRMAPPTPLGPAFTFLREGEYWTVSAPAGVARIKDSRGMQMLAELVAHPGRELHVLAIMGSEGDVVDGGDAGELLDEDAIAGYRSRLKSLGDDLSDRETWIDRGQAARALAEREAIAQELARGVGLGGRGRRAGVAAERARVNVQRRIRGAIRKLGDSLPDLATYLDRTVRTGTFCSYQPL